MNWNQCNIRLKGKGCHSESGSLLGKGSREEGEPNLVRAAGGQDCRAGGQWPSGPAPFGLQFTHIALRLKELNLSDFHLIFIDKSSKSM